MKKRYTVNVKNIYCIVLFNIFSLASNSLFSQVSFTANNLPQVGDIFYNKIIDTTLAPGPSGANLIWNFSNFFLYPTTMNEHFVDPASTPFASSFPGANLAVNSYFLSASNGYDFYNVTANSLQYLGFKSSTDEILITNLQNIITVPLQYGQSVTNQPVTGTGLSGSTLTGTVSATADSYGSLTLYDGTYNNALRVLFDFNLTTSFGGSNPTYYHIQKYSWFGSVRRNPELQVSIIDITGSTNKHFKFVTRAASLAGIEENENIFSKLEILKNPVHAEADIEIQLLHATNVRLEISDITGKIWKAENILPGKLNSPVKIDVADLPRGIYIVAAYSEKNKQLRRLVVE